MESIKFKTGITGGLATGLPVLALVYSLLYELKTDLRSMNSRLIAVEAKIADQAVTRYELKHIRQDLDSLKEDFSELKSRN